MAAYFRDYAVEDEIRLNETFAKGKKNLKLQLDRRKSFEVKLEESQLESEALQEEIQKVCRAKTNGALGSLLALLRCQCVPSEMSLNKCYNLTLECYAAWPSDSLCLSTGCA